jgi:5-methylthioadenosine/S-adenosylhomocysteine deaminase
VGREADLILVDLDRVETLPHPSDAVSLVYAAGGASVRDVIVAGEVLLRDGELLTIDEEKVKEEVKRLAGRYRN